MKFTDEPSPPPHATRQQQRAIPAPLLSTVTPPRSILQRKTTEPAPLKSSLKSVPQSFIDFHRGDRNAETRPAIPSLLSLTVEKPAHRQGRCPQPDTFTPQREEPLPLSEPRHDNVVRNPQTTHDDPEFTDDGIEFRQIQLKQSFISMNRAQSELDEMLKQATQPDEAVIHSKRFEVATAQRELGIIETNDGRVERELVKKKLTESERLQQVIMEMAEGRRKARMLQNEETIAEKYRNILQQMDSGRQAPIVEIDKSMLLSNRGIDTQQANIREAFRDLQQARDELSKMSHLRFSDASVQELRSQIIKAQRELGVTEPNGTEIDSKLVKDLIAKNEELMAVIREKPESRRRIRMIEMQDDILEKYRHLLTSDTNNEQVDASSRAASPIDRMSGTEDRTQYNRSRSPSESAPSDSRDSSASWKSFTKSDISNEPSKRMSKEEMQIPTANQPSTQAETSDEGQFSNRSIDRLQITLRQAFSDFNKARGELQKWTQSNSSEAQCKIEETKQELKEAASELGIVQADGTTVDGKLLTVKIEEHEQLMQRIKLKPDSLRKTKMLQNQADILAKYRMIAPDTAALNDSTLCDDDMDIDSDQANNLEKIEHHVTENAQEIEDREQISEQEETVDEDQSKALETADPISSIDASPTEATEQNQSSDSKAVDQDDPNDSTPADLAPCNDSEEVEEIVEDSEPTPDSDDSKDPKPIETADQNVLKDSEETVVPNQDKDEETELIETPDQDKSQKDEDLPKQSNPIEKTDSPDPPKHTEQKEPTPQNRYSNPQPPKYPYRAPATYPPERHHNRDNQYEPVVQTNITQRPWLSQSGLLPLPPQRFLLQRPDSPRMNFFPRNQVNRMQQFWPRTWNPWS